MPITVTMIEDKEFKIKVRGYDQAEVDEFLDQICDEMINMQSTIQTLREQVKQQQNLPSYAPMPPLAVTPPAPLTPPAVRKEEAAIPHDVEAAQQLLIKTQRACDEVLANAKRRAEEIIAQAEEALPDPEVMELEEEKVRLKDDIAALKREAAVIRKRFQALLADQPDAAGAESELF